MKKEALVALLLRPSFECIVYLCCTHPLIHPQAEFAAVMLTNDFSKPSVTTEAGQGGRKLLACGDPVSNPYTSGTPPASVDWVAKSELLCRLIHKPD